MKVVLFLGAGFSKAWGLPVMNEFFDFATDSRRVTPEEKQFLLELRRCARLGASFLDVRHNNLEDILSFCVMADMLPRTTQNGDAPPYDRFCRILQKVYCTLEPNQFMYESGLVAVFSKLVQSPKSDHRLSILTTNYDTLAEMAFWMIQKPVALPTEFSTLTEGSNKSGASLYVATSEGVMLHKLHGSVNWFADEASDANGGFRVEDRVDQLRFRGERRDQDNPCALPAVCKSGYESPSAPTIVVPTLFKWETDQRFQKIWRSAANALRSAEQVVFIGYSFPESDTYMKYFLAASLHDNVHLRRIDIVDPNAREICERLRSCNYGNVFKQLLHPVSECWEQAARMGTYTIGL